MAPSCMAISNDFSASVCVRPSSELARIRWPVEETGMNSVRPSTTPRVMLSRYVIMRTIVPQLECQRNRSSHFPDLHLVKRQERRGNHHERHFYDKAGKHDAQDISGCNDAP